MLFTGLGRSVLEKKKTVPLVLSKALGHSFFPIRTSRPVNNIYILTSEDIDDFTEIKFVS